MDQNFICMQLQIKFGPIMHWILATSWLAEASEISFQSKIARPDSYAAGVYSNSKYLIRIRRNSSLAHLLLLFVSANLFYMPRFYVSVIQGLSINETM